MSALSPAALGAAITLILLGSPRLAFADPPAPLSPPVAPPSSAVPPFPPLPPPGSYYLPPGGYYFPLGGYFMPPPSAYAPPGGYIAPITAPDRPPFLDYEEGGPIPAGYHRITRLRTNLVAGGAAAFGAGYLITLFVAGFGQLINDTEPKGNASFAALPIPIAGPFVGLGTTRPSAAGAVGLIFLGTSQICGAAMILAALVTPQARLQRDDARRPRLTLQPMIGLGALGLRGEL